MVAALVFLWCRRPACKCSRDGCTTTDLGGFEARLRWRAEGVLRAVFPKGSFPPGLPYIRSGEAFDPLADADAGGSPGTAIWADAAG